MATHAHSGGEVRQTIETSVHFLPCNPNFFVGLLQQGGHGRYIAV